MKTLFYEEEVHSLECHRCGEDLLHPPDGHLLMNDEWKDSKMIIRDVVWICRSCDQGDPYRRWGWKEVSDLFIPDVLIQWILGLLVGMHGGSQKFSDEAMEKILKLLLIIFPHVSKKMTAKQKQVFENLHEIPRCLGGLG